jgi:hypothetical protein
MPDKKHSAQIIFATLVNAFKNNQVKLSFCNVGNGNTAPTIVMYDDKGEVPVAALFPPSFQKLVSSSEEPSISIEEASEYLTKHIAEKNSQSN